MKNKNKKIMLGMFLAMGMSQLVTATRVTEAEHIEMVRKIADMVYSDEKVEKADLESFNERMEALALNKNSSLLPRAETSPTLIIRDMLKYLSSKPEYQCPETIVGQEVDYMSGQQKFITEWDDYGTPRKAHFKWKFAIVTGLGKVEPRYVYLEKTNTGSFVISDRDWVDRPTDGYPSIGKLIEVGNALFYVGNFNPFEKSPYADLTYSIIAPAKLTGGTDMMPRICEPLIIGPKGETFQSFGKNILVGPC